MIEKVFHSDGCLICLETYDEAFPSNCLLLRCGHIFHEVCLISWAKLQACCPICRQRTFVPIQLLDETVQQDILSQTFNQGIEGVKKGVELVMKVSMYGACILINLPSLNYFYPGIWPKTKEEVEAFEIKHGIMLEPRTPQDFFSLCSNYVIFTGIMCGGSAVFYMAKSLVERDKANKANKEIEVIKIMYPLSTFT